MEKDNYKDNYKVNYKDNYKVNVNINKLRNEVQSRENRKFKTFEKVLEMCYHKILTTNKTSDECCCTFICPQVIFGLPLFNLMECINFIMEKLIEKGFQTHLALPNHIYISWKPNSEKHTEELKQYYLQLGAPKQQMQLEYNTNNSIVIIILKLFKCFIIIKNDKSYLKMV
jgi:hypothetical protein